MNKVTGIKSVDFKIKASGHGVINWNGSTSVVAKDGKVVNNHSMPKLRGYSPLSGKVKEENGYLYRKDALDFDLSKTPMYAGQNTIRHHLFRDQNYDLHLAKNGNMEKILASVTGLLRGYVVTDSQFKRTSPLLLEDFVDQLHNGNFEQFSTQKHLVPDGADVGPDTSYTRTSDSVYSKITFGDTEYLSFGSISIEELQFISLDRKFDSCAMYIKEGQGDSIAALITDFLVSLSDDATLKPVATFNANYCRKGTIFDNPEVGILLNDDAIHVLVLEMARRLTSLYIKQAKGYLIVDEVTLDYNDSDKPMRIKKGAFDICSEKNGSYATYYEVR